MTIDSARLTRFTAHVVCWLLMLLQTSAALAQQQRYELRLSYNKNPRVVQRILVGDRVRIEFRQTENSEDDYVSRDLEPIRRGRVVGFEPGVIVLKGGQRVFLGDIEVIYNRSAGRTERVIGALILAGSFGLSAYSLAAPVDPVTRAGVFLVSLLGYPVAGLSFATSLLSDSKAMNLATDWHATIEPR